MHGLAHPVGPRDDRGDRESRRGEFLGNIAGHGPVVHGPEVGTEVGPANPPSEMEQGSGAMRPARQISRVLVREPGYQAVRARKLGARIHGARRLGVSALWLVVIGFWGNVGRAESSPVLPQDEGQKWVEYDIAPYTSRVTGVEKPEQAVVDWILRETGTEIWFSEPLGVLSASRDKLKVYHVPAVQERVKGIVDRMTDRQSDRYGMGVRVVTIGSPNWRAKALPVLRPVPVQAAGVDAWLVSKENAATLLAQLRKRTDFTEYSSPSLVIRNGQSQTLSRRQPRTYVRSLRMRENGWLGYEIEPGSVEEGYSLLLHPLLSRDGRSMDVVIQCQIDQVERFVPIMIDLPGPTGQSQRQQIEVPQLVSWRLHERFRWPSDEVLLLSCGVVAAPGGERSLPLGIRNPLAPGAPRADALLFLDSKGKVPESVGGEPRTAREGSMNFRGRY